MNPLSIATLAKSFNTISILLGAPSFTVLLLYVFHAIRLRLDAGNSSKTNFGENPDAILLMLKGLTQTLGALGRFANSLGQILINGLAAAAMAGLVLALACWFTGRGLHVHAPWARISAGGLLLLLMLPSLLLALSLSNLGRVLMLALVTLCVLGLHTLWLGYTPHAP